MACGVACWGLPDFLAQKGYGRSHKRGERVFETCSKKQICWISTPLFIPPLIRKIPCRGCIYIYIYIYIYIILFTRSWAPCYHTITVRVLSHIPCDIGTLVYRARFRKTRLWTSGPDIISIKLYYVFICVYTISIISVIIIVIVSIVIIVIIICYYLIVCIVLLL